MARYIDADKFIDWLDVGHYRPPDELCLSEGDVKDFIDLQPTADVVEERHGYWIDKPTGRYCHVGSWCSVCQQKSGIGGTESNRHKAYCPNCGAKMDGKE